MAEKRIEIGPLGTQIMRMVRTYRDAQRMTYTELSKRLTELGRPIPVLGLSRIEQGQRRVDVDDLAALGRALGVPPVLLVIPLGEEKMEVFPNIEMDPMGVLYWFSGEGPFGGRGAVDAGWNAFGLVVDLYRKHEAHRRWLDVIRAEAARWRGRAETAGPGSERDSHLANAAEKDGAAQSYSWTIRNLRGNIRSHGFTPPQLPAELQYIDELPEPAGGGHGQED